MMRNSLIAPDELALEKAVVLEEIKRGEDEPSDQVHELHLGFRWGQHPLGKPVIGTAQSVASFERPALAGYMDRRYRAGNVLLAVAGNVEVDAIVEMATRTLGDLLPSDGDDQPARPIGQAGENLVKKDVEQVHFCIGTDGCSVYDDDLYTLIVLDSALGGNMSSRLFQEIRERRGLAYSVGSYMLNYGAGGAFTVYGGTSMDKWPTVQQVVRAEFDKVMDSGLAAGELAKTKRQLAGNLVLALESMSSRMMRMARNELTHEREISVDETLARLEAVTNDQVVTLAQRLLHPDRISTTAIGAFGG
jgi:predicted Zn-dependent peptidase